MSVPEHHLARRALFGGAGAAALAGAATLAGGPAVAADPSGPRALRPPAGRSAAADLASAPVRGYTYRTVGEFDFSVESASATRIFGGRGVHSTGAQTSLWASVDAPAGARLREVEFYVFNNTGSTQYAAVWLWTPDSGYFSTQLLQVPVPSTNAQVAVKGLVASANQGPYPRGTKLFTTLFTPTDGKLQINGARLGFSGGGREVGLLPAPQRILGWTGLKAGTPRTLSVPAGLIGTDVGGVVVNLTARRGAKAGAVQVYAADRSPGLASLSFPKGGTAQAHSVMVPLSASGQIRLRASKAVQVSVDVVGTIG